MSVTHPHLAKELVGADPSKIVAGTDKKLLWRCSKCFFEWVSTGNNRTSGTGCPACSGRVPIPGKTDMASTHPHLAAELEESDPTKLLPWTNKKLSWKCSKCNFKWQAKGSNRANGAGCPSCAGNILIPGKTDMASTHPQLAKELVNADPTKKIAGTHEKLLWKCSKCAFEWIAMGSNRTRGSGCPACYGRVPVTGKTDMAVTHPVLAKELMEGNPNSILAGTTKKLRWQCLTCFYKWSATGSSRVKGNGCPACANKVVICGRNDLKSTHPHLAKEMAEGDPTCTLAGTKEKILWRCSDCLFEWRATGYSRVAGNGCPACANQFVVPGINDMASTHPHLAAELVEGDSSKIVAGTGKKLLWICTSCNHQWLATGSSRVTGTGCPCCAKYGFNPSKPSFFYLIQNDDKFKFGIANHGSKRLDRHRRFGWELIESIDMIGHVAWSLERAVEAAFSSKGIPLGQFRETFHGSTESWYKHDLEVRTIRQLCRRLGVKLDHYLAS